MSISNSRFRPCLPHLELQGSTKVQRCKCNPRNHSIFTKIEVLVDDSRSRDSTLLLVRLNDLSTSERRTMCAVHTSRLG